MTWLAKMRLIASLPVLLAIATSANAVDWMQWDCGKDHVSVSISVTAPWKNIEHRWWHEINVNGLRDPLKDHVTFKMGTYDLGYSVFEAYLNGKRCRLLSTEEAMKQNSGWPLIDGHLVPPPKPRPPEAPQ
jgi:hypothetical protein